MTVIPLTIPPKEVEYVHEGQKYKCTYDKNAPSDQAWVWLVKYTQTYHFIGNAPTMSIAVRRAKSKIHELNHGRQEAEEKGV